MEHFNHGAVGGGGGVFFFRGRDQEGGERKTPTSSLYH